jgi:hypothetical protein
MRLHSSFFLAGIGSEGGKIIRDKDEEVKESFHFFKTYLSSGMMSKQNLLSMDSEILLMQALILKVSFDRTLAVVWL